MKLTTKHTHACIRNKYPTTKVYKRRSIKKNSVVKKMKNGEWLLL